MEFGQVVYEVAIIPVVTIFSGLPRHCVARKDGVAGDALIPAENLCEGNYRGRDSSVLPSACRMTCTGILLCSACRKAAESPVLNTPAMRT